MKVKKNPNWRGLSYFQQFSYGVGHVINDATRRMLQTFQIIFQMRVVGISASNAGLIVFYSLFAGAFIFAPVSGFLCDKVTIPVLSRKDGKKKSWHLFGTITTAIGFPLFFCKCLVCGSGTSDWVVLLYYFLIATVISFSINIVDISHLSIIPVLAKDQSEANKLTALRTGFMYLTGIVSYLVAWLILGQDSRDQLTRESSMDFMVITLILTGVGLVCSGIFHFVTKEPSEDSKDDALFESTADSVTEGSFIPSPVVLQSLAYFGVAEFPHNLFLKNFMTAEKEEHDPTPSMPVVSMTVQGEDDLTFVKVLPKERKISLMMGIFDKMMTKEEDSIKENEAKPDSIRLIDDISEEDGQGVIETGQQMSKVCKEGKKLTSCADNEGVYTNETQLNQRFQDVSQDEGKALSSVASDVESTHPPKPKAVRTWLKDPHLYKIASTRHHMIFVSAIEMCSTDYEADRDFGISKRNCFLVRVILIVAIIYACSKGSQDVFFSYLPLLLTDKLKFGKEAIATLPLILLVSATLSTQISRKLSKKVGNQLSFIVAALTVTGSCLWFMRITQSTRVLTYPAVVLLGFGSSAMFVNALSFATELIGDNKASSGLVFSVVGIISNLTSGTLYLVIQVLFPKGSESSDCQECGNYVQNAFSFVPSSLAAFSLLLVIIFQVYQTICGKKGTEKENEADSVYTTHL